MSSQNWRFLTATPTFSSFLLNTWGLLKSFLKVPSPPYQDDIVSERPLWKNLIYHVEFWQTRFAVASVTSFVSLKGAGLNSGLLNKLWTQS
jgi:hypothetical protein